MVLIMARILSVVMCIWTVFDHDLEIENRSVYGDGTTELNKTKKIQIEINK